MREILGRRRESGPSLLTAALTCAEQWRWPVVPGAGLDDAQAGRGADEPEPVHGTGAAYGPAAYGPEGRGPQDAETHEPDAGRPPREHLGRDPGAGPGGPADQGDGNHRERERQERCEGRGATARCACRRPECPVPGAHPHDPGVLGATSDPRMVRWWWTTRPHLPLILATGSRVSAVSLPAAAGARALGALDRLGVRLGPIVATPTRYALLVAPYDMEELGDLLDRHEWVPTSLRYHGQGGYVVLPPSPVSAGQARWARQPVADQSTGAPWLPRIEIIVDTLVEAGTTAPDGSRLMY
jgi:hypothetical protein